MEEPMLTLVDHPTPGNRAPLVTECLMAESASYLLRMSPELKEAAKALTTISFGESCGGKEKLKSVDLRSLNQSLVYLIKKGIEGIMPNIDERIAKVTGRYKALEEIMTVFINTPSLRFVMPDHFPKGSRARNYVEDRVAGPNMDPLFEFEANLDRREAAEWYASTQEQMFQLIDAK